MLSSMKSGDIEKTMRAPRKVRVNTIEIETAELLKVRKN